MFDWKLLFSFISLFIKINYYRISNNEFYSINEFSVYEWNFNVIIVDKFTKKWFRKRRYMYK